MDLAFIAMIKLERLKKKGKNMKVRTEYHNLISAEEMQLNFKGQRYNNLRTRRDLRYLSI